MKTSFVQLFDAEPAALEALGFITRSFPHHHHSLVRSSNQVQVWSDVKGASDTTTYGAPNTDIIFMVLSIAPD